ncbi:hypothetical protein NB689_003142 [Xanthomonas sacchari]|nr:hypothetical protein [Xanthomonas sacchari]
MASFSSCISVSRRCFSFSRCVVLLSSPFRLLLPNGSLLLPRCISPAPPSLIIEVLAPPGPAMPGLGAGLLPASGLGLRKYSAIAARCSLVVAATSHSTRKNAIIAVTKSA